MKVLKWLDDNIELAIMSLALSLIVVSISADIILRTVTGTGLTWAQELSRQCEICIAAFGMSYAVKADKHIRVDLIQTFLPKTRKPLDVFADIVVFVFSLFIAWYGVTKLRAAIRSGAFTPVLEIPMVCIYGMMEIGFIGAALRVVEKYIKKFLNRGKEVKEA